MTNIDNNSDLLISSNTSSRGYELIDLDLNNKEITNLDIIVLYSSYNLSINESLLNGYLNELDAIKFKGKIAIIKVPGGAFELPVLLLLLMKFGVVSLQTIKGFRRYAIVFIFIASALLTPPDPVSQIGLGVRILILYELSIFSIAAIQKKAEEG